MHDAGRDAAGFRRRLDLREADIPALRLAHDFLGHGENVAFGEEKVRPGQGGDDHIGKIVSGPDFGNSRYRY